MAGNGGKRLCDHQRQRRSRGRKEAIGKKNTTQRWDMLGERAMDPHGAGGCDGGLRAVIVVCAVFAL